MPERDPVVDGGAGNRIKLQAGDTVAGLARSLFSWNADVANLGTSEETLYSNTLPGNTFISNKGWIDYKYWGRFETGADISLIKLRFGGSNYLFNSGDGDEISGVDGKKWKLEGSISRVANTTIIAEGELKIYSLPIFFFTTSPITGLNLASTSYALALRVIASGVGKIVAEGGWARYNPGV